MLSIVILATTMYTLRTISRHNMPKIEYYHEQAAFHAKEEALMKSFVKTSLRMAKELEGEDLSRQVAEADKESREYWGTSLPPEELEDLARSLKQYRKKRVDSLRQMAEKYERKAKDHVISKKKYERAAFLTWFGVDCDPDKQ